MGATSKSNTSVLHDAVRSMNSLIVYFDLFRKEDFKLDVLLQFVDEILEFHKLKNNFSPGIKNESENNVHLPLTGASRIPATLTAQLESEGLAPEQRPNDDSKIDTTEMDSQFLATFKRAIHEIKLQVMAFNVFAQKNSNLKLLIQLLQKIIAKTETSTISKNHKKSNKTSSDVCLGTESKGSVNTDTDTETVNGVEQMHGRTSVDSTSKSPRTQPQSNPSLHEQITITPLATETLPPPQPGCLPTVPSPLPFLTPPPRPPAPGSSFGPGLKPAVNTVPVPSDIHVNLNNSDAGSGSSSESVPQSPKQSTAFLRGLETIESESEVDDSEDSFSFILTPKDSSVSLNLDTALLTNGKRSEDKSEELSMLQPKKKSKLSEQPTDITRDITASYPISISIPVSYNLSIEKETLECGKDKEASRPGPEAESNPRLPLLPTTSQLESFSNPPAVTAAVEVQPIEMVHACSNIKIEPVSDTEMLAIQQNKAIFSLPVEAMPMSFLTKIQEVEHSLENIMKIKHIPGIKNFGTTTENNLVKVFVKSCRIGNYNCEVENMFEPDQGRDQFHVYRKLTTVYICKQGIIFHAPHVTKKELVKLVMPSSEVVAITFRMRDRLISIRTGNKMARWLRRNLGMPCKCPNVNPPNSAARVTAPWFDPFHEDPALKNVVLAPHSLNLEQTEEMQNIFGDRYILDEQLLP